MTSSRRTRTAIGSALLIGAATLGVAALIGSRAAPADTSTTPATIAVSPSTVPNAAAPVTVPSRSVAPTTSLAPSPSPSPSPTTLPLSPLAAQVGPAEPVGVSPPVALPAPVRIDIGDLGVSSPVTPVGVQNDGQLEIPDETEAGWYRLGSSPGEAGATVLAAHVNWHGVDGPFVRLRQLEPGARVTVTLADGSQRVYEVTERTQYGKLELPADRIWTRTGPETLVLITCGGSFNSEIRRYRDNIVAFAVPVA